MPNKWYENLKKPDLTPPNYVFSIVWPILYAMMAVSSYRIWKLETCVGFCHPLVIFSIGLAFNLIWTTLFFKLKKPKLALLDLALIIIFTVWTIKLFYPLDKTAAYLLIPYLVWLLFALYLNSRF